MERVKLKLVGVDGNAFALLGAFQSAARRQGWPAQQITEVTTEARSGDYDHLLATLAKYTEEADEVEADDV
jgi:hypothetical protein